MKDEVRRGDILITSEAPFGEVLLWNSDEKIVLSQRLFALRCREEFFSPFIYYYMLTSKFQGELKGRATGTTVVGLRQPELLKCTIECPSYEEQRKIAAILSALDDKIENNRKTAEKLEEIAAAVFKRWFVDFEFPDAQGKPYKSSGGKMMESELGLIPEGWEVGTVGDIGILNSESWSKSNHPDQIEYVDLSSTNKGRITGTVIYSFIEAPSRARRILKYGDTIWGVVRPSNKSFAYVTSDQLTGSTGFAVITPKEISYREFIYLCLTSEEAIDHFSHLADGAAYPAIRPNEVVDYTCFIPEKKCIEQFHQFASSLYADMINMIEQSKKLTQTRDTLLPKLISGKLSVEGMEA